MIVEELYDALIEAGASEGKARAASRAIADMEGHFADIRNDTSRVEHKVSEFRSDVDRKMSELRSDLEHRMSNLEHKISEVQSDLNRKIAELRTYVEGMFRLHNWMLATILAFVVALFFKEFSR
jgi:predicted  nucleic acid-binding Zn-ribbon protein